MRQFALSLVVALAMTAAAPAQPVRAQQLAVPGGPGGGPPGNATHGLHIPQGNRINFNYNMSDGAGFRWDVQYYGTIGQGTNNAFSGCMYLQINNQGLQPRGQGWSNKTGDEVEIGPFQFNSPVRVYRRIRVYKDQPLCRWLDIFENTSAQEQALQVHLHTNTNYTVAETRTSSGGTTFGPKDWAFVTKTTSGGNSPTVLNIVCDPRSKIRPSVQVHSNTVHLRYNITVPANRSVVLCHFLSQGNAQSQHDKTMRSFRSYRLVKDLPVGVQKAILNFTCARGIEGVELDRSDSEDSVILKRGDPIFGRIQNTGFALQTLFGELKLKQEEVVGMAAGLGSDDQVRFVLTNGQVVRGQGPDMRLSVALGGGGHLDVPIADISQWSYRVSEAKPADQPFAAPQAVLRTGDILRFDPSRIQVSFRTRYGLAALRAEDLQSIVLDNPGNIVHRCTFVNGTRVGGFLEPARISLALTLGAGLEVDRDLLVQLRFSEDETRAPNLAQVIMNNEDELFGRFVDRSFRLATKYNAVDLAMDHVKSMKLEDGQLAVEMWNGTIHRGVPAQAEMPFEIVPGTVLKLPANQIVSVVRPDPLPPDDIRKQVETLVARLGAESYKDRQEASEKLAQLGKGIVPLLQKLAENPDVEVRHRIQEVLDKLGAAAAPDAGGDPNNPFMQQGVFFGR